MKATHYTSGGGWRAQPGQPRGSASSDKAGATRLCRARICNAAGAEAITGEWQ